MSSPAQITEYIKELHGVRLFYFLVLCFVVCLFFGIVFGYAYVLLSVAGPARTQVPVQNEKVEKYYEGRIDFVDSRVYPGKDISYVLVNPRGDVLYFLSSDNSILQVAEGHFVKVFGEVKPKMAGDKYDTIEVTKVSIKSTTE